jgi:hypothetical protein
MLLSIIPVIFRKGTSAVLSSARCSLNNHHHIRRQAHRQQIIIQQRRNFAIYAVGEGWTGALTRQHILKAIPGHFDEDDENDVSENRPVVIYPYDDIKQATVGWGCTAILDTRGTVKTVGRPHDVMSLLRMNRMPRMLQNYINKHKDPVTTTPVGAAISNLIGWSTGNEPDKTTTAVWDIAQKYSFLHDWTVVDGIGGTSNANSSKVKQVECGPGFMAFLVEEGTLFMMGVNNRGQCGNGTTSNNVWTPEPVRGLSLSLRKTDDRDINPAAEQDQPILQVALGFQHGYALSQDGHVFSWGKATRGQLGRDIDFDQDSWAGPILLPDIRAVQIGAGHHHGALLTDQHDVYIWGKNMGRGKSKKDETSADGEDEGEDDQYEIQDARKPEKVLGLPEDSNGYPIKVQRISCGSHHTAMLLEDGSVYGVGIASDEAVPILDPVELIPAGIIDRPVRQFEAHHDRTTVIDDQGTVFQTHLWKDETLREYSYFTPAYVDAMLDEGQAIQSIHRGWRHTIIVTKPIEV